MATTTGNGQYILNKKKIHSIIAKKKSIDIDFKFKLRTTGV